MDRLPYRAVWTVDFEFSAPSGERPVPHCVVARELKTGRLVRQWLADDAPALPPYGTGEDVLLVAYYSSAEWTCHLGLGWPMPRRVLDLFTEFRCLTSGLSVPCGNGLLGALTYFGLDALDAAAKEAMRELAIRGSPFTVREREDLLAYCQSDVDALARLLPAMLPHLDLGLALLRGRYMVAAARMEWAGVPIDADALASLRQHWDGIKGELIRRVDADYGVFVPTGQREIDPNTRLGAAILTEARNAGIDPHDLADALDYLWRTEREATRDIREAHRAARKVTGLTSQRIGRLEDAGKDHSNVAGLDVKARELAGTYPALGIGRGYREDGYEENDQAALLWDVLREPDPPARPKHDPALIRQATEFVVSSGPREHPGPRTFSAERWAAYLTRKGIPWPRLESGALALDDDTFKEQARIYPAEVSPIRELRHALSQLRLNELAVGGDGRNRLLLSAFRSQTSRNQPSNSKFIFGPSCWLRSLIRPGLGRAVAYVDWSQQELAIAAALSGDKAMQDCYLAGDFYLTFAKMAGAVPKDATKQTHGAERDQFKTVALGVLYGLSGEGLARKLNVPPCRGRELLELHRRTFRRFWKWSDAVETQAMLTCRLQTVFGWTVHTARDANPRSLRNFPMQANGAEMMRLACCLATERGVSVCCPVHDALLVEGDADRIEEVVQTTQDAMREASETVLDRFTLRTEAKIVRYPNRFSDPRGERMWGLVSGLLADLEGEDTRCTDATPPVAPVHTPSSLIVLSLSDIPL